MKKCISNRIYLYGLLSSFLVLLAGCNYDKSEKSNIIIDVNQILENGKLVEEEYKSFKESMSDSTINFCFGFNEKLMKVDNYLISLYYENFNSYKNEIDDLLLKSNTCSSVQILNSLTPYTNDLSLYLNGMKMYNTYDIQTNRNVEWYINVLINIYNINENS